MEKDSGALCLFYMSRRGLALQCAAIFFKHPGFFLAGLYYAFI